MASVNKVIVVGNLGRDPETRTTSTGRIVHLSVATSESWKDKSTGEKKEKTEWHRVVIFNERIGDIAERWLRKGSKVYLEGSLQTRKWAGDDGVDRYSTEIVLAKFRGELTLLDGRGDGDNGRAATHDAAWGDKPSGYSPRASVDPKAPPADFDDEIPF